LWAWTNVVARAASRRRPQGRRPQGGPVRGDQGRRRRLPPASGPDVGEHGHVVIMASFGDLLDDVASAISG